MTIDATVANQYELSETAAALEAAGASASFLAQFTATSGYTVERVELAALRIDGALTLDLACGGERSMSVGQAGRGGTGQPPSTLLRRSHPYTTQV